MKTATGSQERPIKKDDPGWEEYQENLERWENERDELQEAVTFVFALKSYSPNGTSDNLLKIPAEKLHFSEETEILIQSGLVDNPDDGWIKKFMWVRDRVLGMHDEYNITLLIQKRSGVPDDLIDQMKDSFRRTLLGQTTEILGDSASEDVK